jgi:hypothetical protein
MVTALLRKGRAIAQVMCNFIVNSNVFTLQCTQVTEKYTNLAAPTRSTSTIKASTSGTSTTTKQAQLVSLHAHNIHFINFQARKELLVLP